MTADRRSGFEARMVARVLFDMDNLSRDEQRALFKLWDDDPQVLEVERSICITGPLWKEEPAHE